MKKGHPHPPRWADYLLAKFYRGDKLEEVQGDLHESFEWRLTEHGSSYAKRQFVKEMLLSARISNLKPYPHMMQLLTLFSSHLKTGWRFLWKTKAYSAINVLGLSIGMVFSWFAYQYAADQLGYNKHIKHVNDLYRISMKVNMMGTEISFPGGSHKIASMIVSEIPEVTEVALFRKETDLMTLGKSVVNQGYLIANTNLIDYLSLEFVEGSDQDFNDPYNVLISEKLAYKLNIRGNAINKTLQLKDTVDFKPYNIIGVFKEIPSNTSVQTDLFLPYSHYHNPTNDNLDTFMNFDLSIILKTTAAADIAIIREKISQLIERETESEGGENQYGATILPIASLHTDERYVPSNGFMPGANSQLMWFIIAAGLLCLIISIINYANFSISMYINRAREIAVRKIMGSARIGVFQQLMTESLLTTLLAALLSVILYLLIAPQFSQMVEKTFDLSTLFDRRFIPGNLVIILVISLLSGLYPAFLLSRFKIIKSLKGDQKVGTGKVVMQTLLVLQFSISVIMITCMFTFRNQLNLLTNFDRGINVENVININFPDLDSDKGVNVFSNQLEQYPDILQKARLTGMGMNPLKHGDLELALLNMAVDSSYFDLLRLEFVEGTNFSSNNGIQDEVIVNEALVWKLGLVDPIGKRIPFQQEGFKNSIIVGVVKNHYTSKPRREVHPFLFYKITDEPAQAIYVRTSSDTEQAEVGLKEAWEATFSPMPFDYQYLAVRYNNLLDQEAKIAKISSTGSIIAIFIAAFGLLGLVGLTVRQKLKEVSIRRVLGADIQVVALIILQKFIIPIAISLIFGLSVSYHLATTWLDRYQVRIQFGWIYLTASALIILGILFLIIVAHARRVIKDNPVLHLKDE